MAGNEVLNSCFNFSCLLQNKFTSSLGLKVLFSAINHYFLKAFRRKAFF